MWGSELNPQARAILTVTDSLGRLQTFKRYEGSSQADGFVCRTADTTLYLLGGDGGNVFFLRTRPDGRTIWQRTFSGRGAKSYPYGLSQTRNGDWLVAVCYDYFSAEIYRLAPDGTMRWRKDLTFGSLTNQLYQIQETADGGIAVCGMIDNAAFVMKLTATGTTQWTRSFGNGGLWSAKSFVELPNGQFFVHGYLIQSQGRDVLMARISADGRLLWARALTRADNEDVGYGCYLDTDGNVILTGYTFPPSVAHTDFVVGKFTPSGRMLWGKTQSSPSDEGVDNGPNHTVRVGSHFFSTGFTNAVRQGQGGFDLMLLRYQPATNTSCLPNDYVLTERADTSVQSAAPSWQARDLAPLASLGTNLSVADAEPCQLACAGSLGANVLGPDQYICPGVAPTPLDATYPNSTYLWSDGSTGATLAPTQPGTYWVRITNGCGSFTDTVRIRLRPSNRLPIDTSGPLRFCVPGSVRLLVRGAPSGVSIRWSNGQTDSAINVQQSGIYAAVITYPSGCQQFTDTVIVVAKSNPVRPIIAPAGTIDLCQPGPRQIAVQNIRLLDRYTWNTGQPGTTLNPSRAQAYWVTSISPEGCPRNSDTVLAIIRPLPLLAGLPQAICQGDTVRLGEAPLPGYAYSWQPSTLLSDATMARPLLSAIGFNLLAQPQVLTYTVTVPGLLPECRSQDTTTVTVYPIGYEPTPPNINCARPLEIPNVVTPGVADGANDAFRIRNLEFYPDNRLQIFNRYGRLVFEAKAYDNNWQGLAGQSGVYYYRLEVPSKGWAFTGWLEIVR